MATSYNNDVYTHTFTPHEYQVELLGRIKEFNTIICSNTSGAKAFIAIKLLQEQAWQLRTPIEKRAFYILEPQNTKVLASHLTLLTDLPVIIISSKIQSKSKWMELKKSNAIFILTIEVCLEILSYSSDMSFISFIIIDDGMFGEKQCLLKQLMSRYESDKYKPRIVGLVTGLLGDDLKPAYLEAEMVRLEALLKSSVDTSSEITTLIRLSSKPKELLLTCRDPESIDLKETIRIKIENLRMFLLDHRYDPTEIYSDEFVEELRNMPDPKIVPLKFLDDFLFILEEYGLWCADQAALQILIMIEKLKVKVAYERHYLLLCVVSTTMVSVRSHCEDFIDADIGKDVVYNYSTQKICRFIEILGEMGPSESEKPRPEDQPPPPPPEPIKTGKKSYKGQRRPYQPRLQTEDSICALVFVENTLIAKVIHALLYNLYQIDPKFWWISVLYTADKKANPITESREAEIEHRRQEEVLRKFRSHECNIMVATSILEQGYDLPKCNLVIRLDVPKTFHSYIYTKARARTPTSYYITLVYESDLEKITEKYSEYMEVEFVLLRRCGNINPSPSVLKYCDEICEKYAPYVTAQNETVTLNTAIQLVNRYCAKLPSDTFTKLVPNYNFIHKDGKVACILRLPINSPLKLTVTSPFIKNEVLAKRFAAFYMCQLLHKSNELDNFLNPITKENFRAIEEDWNDFSLEKEDEELSQENIEQRPGTTKRRQYYYKRVAAALKDCLPQSIKTYFYKVVMTLTCPIPEEQNTRGRKIYPPEESTQGFGILTSREIPQICPFPIFTRSGEVKVSFELCQEDVVLDKEQIHKIQEFLNYTFTSVLRLQKYQMLFDPTHAENSYFIVPTITDIFELTEIDWNFLELIYEKRDVLPQSIPDANRVDYVFDGSQYKDAVVMPWYRNQDQPQYFYVAEICTALNPHSAFPGSEYATFHEYYERKYGIEIQNKEQYLLDVDHTSARLNFLTPRYVNRKGVALPTSSEETKRAKRENLEQKQILVPELCAIHPFPASLWRKAVCLPCVLYRMNALLLADQIRRTVAEEINLGKKELSRSFKWDPLNFGWSLSDVLRKMKSPEKEKVVEAKQPDEIKEIVTSILKEMVNETVEKAEKKIALKTCEADSNASEDSEGNNLMEIGTWSNDMVESDEAVAVAGAVRYGSPTSWMHSTYGYNEYDDFSDTDSYYSSDDAGNDSECGGLHIEFQGDYLAEAVDKQEKEDVTKHDLHMTTAWENNPEMPQQLENRFNEACKKHKDFIEKNMIISGDFQRDPINNMQKEDSKIDLANLIIEDYPCPPLNYRKATIFKDTIATNVETFSFDRQPDLSQHPGPSPSVILQALTMSNANDGINLERLETIGDSFLKYAITDYLYSKYENTHEGKLSHLRSKQVSNLNLYRLGKRKCLGDMMIATKFDPHDNWLPPCYCVSRELEEALSKARIPGSCLTLAEYVATRNMTVDEICTKIREQGESSDDLDEDMIPYNLVTQHSIPDKSIADCVEALIGAYLISCGPRGALLFMAWLGIRVLPKIDKNTYGELHVPDSPLLQHLPNPEKKLELLLNGYERFEQVLGYNFRDRSYLLQALTDASYSPNEVTDCYQRLEFLGDAVLDYLITRHLYEDQRMHSPGALTDLRSALVNNTIFASLAVKYDYHKYFRYLSPGLHQVIEKFIRIQEDAGHKVTEELYLLDIEDNDEVEDVEVPKVLGDVFESVAGAIFLDSGRSLDAVWRVYYKMMKNEIEQFSDKVPKSPIRELLELEPETAKFGTAEKLADGRRVRVSVEVFGKGVFKGIGRNYRIAKCTAAKCALKHLKKQPGCARLM